MHQGKSKQYCTFQFLNAAERIMSPQQTPNVGP